MSKKSKIILMPAIISATFVLSFWISSVRESQSILGMSSDLASGVTIGLGIGLALVLLSTLNKSNSSN
ncbi:hypothetical protein GCM10009347_04060 [Shewanella algicola]|nr:hypothetical protein GCM10009347_04060 [Shewanella algicola]